VVGDSFPTFKKWLTTFELTRSRRWRIVPFWRFDTTAAQQRTLLRVLSAAIAQNLNAAPLVARLAEDHRRVYRWKLGRLARRLAAGMPLADALEQTPGALSAEATLAVRFGAQSGTLSATLATLVDETGVASARIMSRVHRTTCYFVGVMSIAASIVTFVVIKLVPILYKIQADFEVESTWPLNLLVGVSNFVVAYWLVLVLLGLAVAWLFYSQAGWRYVHHVWLPRLSRSVTKLRGADVLGLLAVAQRAGRPLAGSLSTLARYHFDRRVRQQLLFVRNEVEQGADVWSSMVEARMLSADESQALVRSVDTASRVWTMERLAELRREQAARRIEMVVDLLHPALALVLAAGVLLFALATLVPLIKIIETNL